MNTKMIILITTLVFAVGFNRQEDRQVTVQEQTAIEYFKGVYSGDLSIVQKHTSVEIKVSYPIFETIFGSPVIEGQESLEGFIKRFSTKWGDPEIQIDQVISEGDFVVLVWSFEAFDLLEEVSDLAKTRQKIKWGGISLLRFNRDGKVVLETGEESAPGPYGRLAKSETK